MKIEIDDEVDGKTRRKKIILETTRYALTKYRSKVEAAKFLGISTRSLRSRIEENAELHEFKYFCPAFMKGWSDEKIANYFRANKDYLDPQTSRYYQVWKKRLCYS